LAAAAATEGSERTRGGGRARKQALVAGDLRGGRACTEGDGCPITPAGVPRQLVAPVQATR